ncbi:ABC transporter permease [Devosia sp. ZB163]|uniref:ABC transporter permease n=1 Tax=Devosia sp. ZB163 TaxID=3025938 RepID=UPI00235E47C3|nr:ABC transporter permease [Devosia sp. ZB163]MDC9822777.1 ABC transporter permease [Devosia sp. ZB163]
MTDTPTSATAPAGKPEIDAAIRRQQLTRILLQVFGIGTFYLVVLVFFAFASPYFFTYSNATNILTNVAVIGIVAMGQSLAVISGGFDLSVAGTLPLGAVVYAVLINAGVPIPVAMLVVVLAGSAVGLINGLIITKIKINPLIVTLGTMSIAGGVAYTVSNGVTLPFANYDAGILAEHFMPGVAWYVLLFVGIAIATAALLRFSIFGRMIYAVGGNAEASRLAGIRVDLVTIGVYLFCGALAAVAGIVVASQLLAGSATVGSDAALSSIAAVVLGGASLSGGVGGIAGTLIGVLILGTVANGMALLQVPAFYQQIATGLILLMGVGFARLREVLGRETT